jgi:hypothetical protein
VPGLELPGADHRVLDGIGVSVLDIGDDHHVLGVGAPDRERLGDGHEGPICDDGAMPRVVRIETLADVGENAGPRTISVSARHEAVLDDGRRLSLLDGRGWAESLRGAGADGVADIWSVASEREIAETARTVVGPDEPFGGHTQESMEASHWQTLAETLGTQGVVVDPGELRHLPHDVVLSERLRARLGPGGSG